MYKSSSGYQPDADLDQARHEAFFTQRHAQPEHGPFSGHFFAAKTLANIHAASTELQINLAQLNIGAVLPEQLTGMITHFEALVAKINVTLDQAKALAATHRQP